MSYNFCIYVLLYAILRNLTHFDSWDDVKNTKNDVNVIDTIIILLPRCKAGQPQNVKYFGVVIVVQIIQVSIDLKHGKPLKIRN